MQTRPLGRTGLDVSLVGLGTMTWGKQNTEAEAHAQMDLAVGEGVTLLDAAEMYPVPPEPETQGRTEAFIGTWLKSRNARAKVVLATKVAGPGMAHIRGGSALDAAGVRMACETSLKRLQTDVIDLYQVHWPARTTNYFGRLGYAYDADGEPGEAAATGIAEVLEALAELVAAGKVRHVGLSNETPWGLSEYLRLSRENTALPRIASLQNPYSLLNRSYEVGLAEFAHRESVGLLAYSPLAFGKLSGKYADGAAPADGRLTLFARFQRYNSPEGDRAVAAYGDLAKAHGLDPAQMALAWVYSRPFVTSCLIGATTLQQLRSNLDAARLELTAAVLDGIEAIHRRHTIPCP